MIKSGSTDFSLELRFRFPGTTLAVDTCLCLLGLLSVTFLDDLGAVSQADLLRTFFLLIVPVLFLTVTVFSGSTTSAKSELSGSSAIRLNFRLRFVLGRLTGEKFSLTESVSATFNNFLFVWIDPPALGVLMFLLRNLGTMDAGRGILSSSESDNWRLDVPRSLVMITARVSSSELDDPSLFCD